MLCGISNNIYLFITYIINKNIKLKLYYFPNINVIIFTYKAKRPIKQEHNFISTCYWQLFRKTLDTYSWIRHWHNFILSVNTFTAVAKHSGKYDVIKASEVGNVGFIAEGGTPRDRVFVDAVKIFIYIVACGVMLLFCWPLTLKCVSFACPFYMIILCFRPNIYLVTYDSICFQASEFIIWLRAFVVLALFLTLLRDSQKLKLVRFNGFTF